MLTGYAKKKLLLATIIVVLSLLMGGCSQQPQQKAAEIGERAPNFCLKDIEGNIIILSYWENSPVILRFWETDCMFCRADTPVFTEFYETYKDQGLKMVYISSFYEKLKDIRSFVQQYDLDFHVIMDEKGQLAELFNVNEYPKTLTISPDHIVTASLSGGVGEAELQELVGKYLKPIKRKEG